MSSIMDNMAQVCKQVMAPIVCQRVDEFVMDAVQFTVPFMSHTTACCNYIKRQIRHAVFFKDKENGSINFGIDPYDSWLLDMQKVDVPSVTEQINTWLATKSQNKDAETMWPKRICWMGASLNNSKIGDRFIVYFYESAGA